MPSLLLGGCVLLAAHSDVDPGKWTGWTHALRLEVGGSDTCTAIALHVPGTTRVELDRGHAAMADLPSHPLREARLQVLPAADGGLDVLVHLPELGPLDRARIDLVLRDDGGWDPFVWRPGREPAEGPWTLRLPRKVSVDAVGPAEIHGRRLTTSTPDTRLVLTHPGAIAAPDPEPHVAPADTAMTFDEASARLATLDFLPPGFAAPLTVPQGEQARHARLVDRHTAAHLLHALTDRGPDDVRIARWVAAGDPHPPLATAPEVAVRIGPTPAPWLHPDDRLGPGTLHLDDGTTLPFAGQDGPPPVLAPHTATSTISVRTDARDLTKAWAEDVVRTDQIRVHWADDAQGLRLARHPWPFPPDALVRASAACAATRVGPHDVVLVSTAAHGDCTLTASWRVHVPWGEPFAPDVAVEAASAIWRLPDGTERTGLVHVVPEGFWIEALGDAMLVPPGRGAAAWIAMAWHQASVPEPGVPVSFRRQEGWDAVLDLRELVVGTAQDLPADLTPWAPRPLHGARRGGALTDAERAFLCALHLRQARREAEVGFVTRSDVPVPIGIEAVVVRVRTDGGEAWTDLLDGDDTPLVLPDALRGRSVITTDGVDRTP